LLSHEVLEEFSLMRAQIEYEAERRIPTFRETFKLYRHRALVFVVPGIADMIRVLTYAPGASVCRF
jgi:hypothetical protein